MEWMKSIGFYILLVYLWLGILWIYSKFLKILENKFTQLFKKNQRKYLAEENMKKIVRSFKYQMFIEDKINKLTPHFPLNMSIESESLLRKEIRRNYDNFFFYLRKLWPLKIVNLIFIYLIFSYHLEFNIIKYFLNVFSGVSINEIGSSLKLVPTLLAIMLITIALYFTSRSGLFRKAKNKVIVEEIENKIKFHKENRVILAPLLYAGSENIEQMFLNRKDFIKQQYSEKKLPFRNDLFWLKDIQEINELNRFIEDSAERQKDLLPFFIGVRHISFVKTHNTYNKLYQPNRNIEKELNGIFLTKSHIELLMTKKYFTNKLEGNLNRKILESIETVVYLEKYLDIINKQLNKPHTIYSFFAFITNKDK